MSRKEVNHGAMRNGPKRDGIDTGAPSFHKSASLYCQSCRQEVVSGDFSRLECRPVGDPKYPPR